MITSARLFYCGRCRTQTVVCSACDRGQIYCSGTCAQEARKESLRRAGRRYAQTRKGQFNAAKRQRDARRRRKEKVTHQGIQADVQSGVVPGLENPVEPESLVSCPQEAEGERTATPVSMATEEVHPPEAMFTERLAVLPLEGSCEQRPIPSQTSCPQEAEAERIPAPVSHAGEVQPLGAVSTEPLAVLPLEGSRERGPMSCHFCGTRCSGYLRHRFLRSSQRILEGRPP